MAKTNNTYVGIVLDESGSMGFGKDITISHFNEQLQTIQKGAESLKGDTKVTFFSFNDSVRALFEGVNAKKVKPIDSKQYNPSGCTALFDAINETIDSIKRQQGAKDKDSAVLLIILTDGMENASKISGDVVGSRIKELEATGKWTFTLMGPNSDVKNIAQILKMNTGNISGFNANSLDGRMMASAQMSDATHSYFELRSQGISQSKSFYDTKKENA